MSYLEPGYHKPGDKPFTFPPNGVDSKIGANLIEIEGRNGSGKTTLLNVLALALGYLDREKELDTKPALKRKLQDLDRNETLEYNFRICCDEPQPVELLIERKKGQKQKCCLNSKSISPENMAREFDVVFLTEDDPKKVVTASLGKLSRYFRDLDNGLNSLSHTLTKYMIEIDEFLNFKKNEKALLKEVKEHKHKIEQSNSEIAKLKDKLEKAELRKDIQEKLELLSNEGKITSQYNSLKKKYEQLKGKKNTDIFHKIYKEREKLFQAENELKDISARVIQTCDSLAHYGIILHSDKLLRDNYSEFNRIMTKTHIEKKSEMTKIAIVDEMIELLEHHSQNDIVPLIDKPVGEALRELYRIKARLSFDRVFGLLGVLRNHLDERKNAITNRERINERISFLSTDVRDLKDIENIENAFLEAQEKYLRLQHALQQDKLNIASQWNQLRSIEGDPEVIRNQLQTLEVQTKTEDSMRIKCEESLKILRENASEEPEYKNKEKKLQVLNNEITRMRENLSNWVLILAQPTEAREQFTAMKEKMGFGLADYQKFVKAVGEFLGNQFEPVSFADKLHEVKFFDIEKDKFVTKEDREIPIDKLSQGQSKITTLTGSFKEMEEGRKKIVLIDEIADLDPENLQKVKSTLKDKFDEGKLALAILVRPTHDPTSGPVNIRWWG